MAKGAHGWKLKGRGADYTKTVVFWDPTAHKQRELSTGEKDPKRAKARATQLVAQALRGASAGGGVRPCVKGPLSTEQLATEWIESLDGLLDAKTRAEYNRVFQADLVPAFPSILDVTVTSTRAFISEQLKTILASSVRKKLSALRGLLAWCVETGKLSDAPILPGVPKRATGTRYGKPRRVKAFPVTKTEALAIIKALPESSPRLGPVRPRFEIQYEHGLRSGTMDKLELGVHWRRGAKALDLSPGDLKNREETQITLTKRARRALTRACRGLVSGLIFGPHDYRNQISKAAKAVLPTDRAELFAPTHLRSHAITHFLMAGASLPDGQKFAGHKLITTTNNYVLPTRRSMEAELRRQGRL